MKRGKARKQAKVDNEPTQEVSGVENIPYIHEDIKYDYHTLLQKCEVVWTKEGSPIITYALFKEQWKDLKYPVVMLFENQNDELTECNITMLYQVAIELLIEQRPLNDKVVMIYTLFTVYHTQPTKETPVPIRLPYCSYTVYHPY